VEALEDVEAEALGDVEAEALGNVDKEGSVAPVASSSFGVAGELDIVTWAERLVAQTRRSKNERKKARADSIVARANVLNFSPP